jgi:ParB-like chromosome segregation protein Spo0J
MKELTIIDELKNLLPPLTDAEFTGLEESIVKDGCLSPLVVWNDILVDGHHRYEICSKHQIPFAVKSVVLENLDEAKIWIWQHQGNRRNLTDFQRVEIALKLKNAIAAKAKERQRAGGGDHKSENAKSVPQLFAEPIETKETRQELAEMAGVSHTTLDKVEYISEHADDETKDKLRRGEKGTSISKEYNRLKKQSLPKPDESVTKSDVTETEKSVADSEVSEPVKETKYFPKTTLRLIPQESPYALLVNLFEIFRKGYVEEMIVMAMEMLDANRGKGSVKAMMSQLNKKFGKK